MAKNKNNKEQVKKQTAVVRKISEFKQFFEQSKMEMKKVTYPSQKQLLTTSASVVVLVIIVALFLGLVDVILTKIMEVIMPGY